jgi:hypothetical protein
MLVLHPLCVENFICTYLSSLYCFGVWAVWLCQLCNWLLQMLSWDTKLKNWNALLFSHKRYSQLALGGKCGGRMRRHRKQMKLLLTLLSASPYRTTVYSDMWRKLQTFFFDKTNFREIFHFKYWFYCDEYRLTLLCWRLNRQYMYIRVAKILSSETATYPRASLKEIHFSSKLRSIVLWNEPLQFAWLYP